MQKVNEILKYLFNQIILKCQLYSLEKIFMDAIKEENRLGEILKKELNFLYKGIPANRILKLLKLKHRTLAEIIELITELPQLNKSLRKDLSKIFNALYSVNQTYYDVINFFAALEKKLYIMNLSITFLYSIVPWLIQFIYIAKKTFNLLEIGLLMPNIITMIFYYSVTLLITVFSTYRFYSFSRIFRQVLFVSCLFWFIQILLYIIIG